MLHLPKGLNMADQLISNAKLSGSRELLEFLLKDVKLASRASNAEYADLIATNFGSRAGTLVPPGGTQGLLTFSCAACDAVSATKICRWRASPIQFCGLPAERQG